MTTTHFPRTTTTATVCTVAIFASLASLQGCSKVRSHVEAVVAQRGGGSSGKGRAAAKPSGDEDQDYWKGIEFDKFNFDEVNDYVDNHYIDKGVDKKRGWLAAANAALGLLVPAQELVPSTFYEARKNDPDEEGRLDGDTRPFSCGALSFKGVLLHKVPGVPYLKFKRKKRPDRRLTDDEIRALRASLKKRYRAYRDSWGPHTFGRREFACVMGYVKSQLPETLKRLKARRAARSKAGKSPQASTKTQGSKTAAGAEAVSTKGVKAAETATKAETKPKVAPALYAFAPADDNEDENPPWEPDMNRAWLAASTAFLHALDPHSAVIPRRQWDDSTRRTQDNSFEGIGAVLSQRQKRTVVENPMEDLPAWRAGVRAGDEIIKVDGTDIRGWLLGKVVKKIRGKKHTIVTLTVRREGEPKPLDIAIRRAHIPIKNVTGKLLPDHEGIAHVKMTGFVPRSAIDLRAMIETLRKRAPKGQLKAVVLDLRRNSGGLLNKAIDVADMFLKRGVVVSVKSRGRRMLGRPEVHRADEDDDDYNLPLVVLVDDGSASASEIVASAIQENGRGLVVGQRTFGKASVQTLFEPEMHRDYYIKLTVARYYSPSGKTIQVTGVHPDVVIPEKADGKTHIGFREENLTNHLEPIDPPGKSPMAPVIPALQKCVKRSGKAHKIATRSPRPQVAPDFQLLQAADYAGCLARLHAGK